MKNTVILISFFLLLTIGSLSRAMGDVDMHVATFEKIKGKVTVKGNGGLFRKVHKSNQAYGGETIKVAAKSEAEIALFDGSVMDLMANSRLTLAVMKQPTPLLKNILLNLGMGKVYVQVKKLLSAHSTFEIETGGVICGVRGTEFSVGYDPSIKRMDLNVFKGAVAATVDGTTHVFMGGQQGLFRNGQWDGRTRPAPPPPVGVFKQANANGNSSGTGATSTGNNTNSTGTNGGTASGSNSGSSTSSGDTSTNNGSSASSSGGTSASTGGSNGSNGGSSVGSQGNVVLGTTSSLNDLNNQFLGGTLINGENNLTQAQQTINIRLIVPPSEIVP